MIKDFHLKSVNMYHVSDFQVLIGQNIIQIWGNISIKMLIYITI